MKLEHALAAVRFVVDNATAPVSVFVADDHGEVVAAATMDGAAPDTRLNAQRKAYTAARSDATSTAELAAKARADAAERASFDPFFTFFQGGVAAFDGRPARRRRRSERATGTGRRCARARRDPLRGPFGKLDRSVRRSTERKPSEEDHAKARLRHRTRGLDNAAVVALPGLGATPKMTGTVGPGFTIR